MSPSLNAIDTSPSGFSPDAYMLILVSYYFTFLRP